jgi:hypothetical protein
MQLQIYFGTLSQLFDVKLIPSSTDVASASSLRRRLSLDFTQKIVSVTDSSIQVQFNFTSPLEVTPQDSIVVSMKFGAFEKGLPEDQTITIPCSR